MVASEFLEEERPEAKADETAQIENSVTERTNGFSRFQNATARKCWDNFVQFQTNPGQKCPRCWRMTKFCCCLDIPKVQLRPKVLVVFHYEELGQHTATNTANLLLHYGAELYCCGLEEHDHRLHNFLAEDSDGTLILFPSPDAVEASSFALKSHRDGDASTTAGGGVVDGVGNSSDGVAIGGGDDAASEAKSLEDLPRRIVVLDGGWSQCKKMNAWLDPTIPRCVVKTASREEFGGTRRYRAEGESGRVQTAAAFVALLRELGEDQTHVQAVSDGLVKFMQSFESQMGRSRT
eukprot:TRINITY_DN8868_c0_g1_i1.p1 TRINITY_DN8868_c0_g1~~TRINITY_DN8868_c0_g1_i1.p1  ORF type:complete len:293 (-),score=56.39 TRINITY_DN8868_c0_g1_i1:266-1144(-)